MGLPEKAAVKSSLILSHLNEPTVQSLKRNVTFVTDDLGYVRKAATNGTTAGTLAH